ISYWRASSVTTAFGASDSRTIRSLSSRPHRRRRSTPTRMSIRSLTQRLERSGALSSMVTSARTDAKASPPASTRSPNPGVGRLTLTYMPSLRGHKSGTWKRDRRWSPSGLEMEMKRLESLEKQKQLEDKKRTEELKNQAAVAAPPTPSPAAKQ